MVIPNIIILVLPKLWEGVIMADYKKMYYILCDAASRALDALPEDPEAAAAALQKALDEAEEKYIETAEE